MKSYFLKNLFSGLLFLLSFQCWAELTSTVDRSVLAENESLQLVIRFSGQSAVGEPDFSPIQKDFEIVTTSRQQQYSIINGKSESFTDWKMLLLPKRSGQLSIPSLNFKGHTTQAITVRVRPASLTASASSNGDTNQPVYTETEIDKPTAYTQEQIILTVRLITSVQLQDFSLTELEIPNVLVQRVAENQYQKVINGKNHLVVEIKFALFAQQVGKLEIPALRIGAYEVASFGQYGGFPTRGKRLMRLTDAKIIDILPTPTAVKGNQWMPSSDLSISENWSNNSAYLKVGEPVTRTIIIAAQGLTAAQIQPLPEQQTTAYKLYPDQPKLNDQISAQGVLGQRIETFAIVPNKAGELTMPPVNIQWWDTVNKRLKTSTLPSKTLTVMPADLSEKSEGISVDNMQSPVGDNLNPDVVMRDSLEVQQGSSLIRLSLILNALLIAALVTVLYIRRPTVRSNSDGTEIEEPTEKQRQHLKQIQKQASAGNLGAMRDSILIWGTHLYSEQLPKTLHELGLLMDNDQIVQQFDRLDQHLFKLDSNPERFDPAELISQLKRHKRSAKQQTSDNGLKPLYPQK
jgi:hypothetical protein